MNPIRGTIHGNPEKIHTSVRIDVDDIYLGNNVTIGPETLIKGGEIRLGNNTSIEKDVEVNATYFRTGEDSIVRSGSYVHGKHIEGNHRFYLDRGAEVGGGSAFDWCAFLKADNWMHLGKGAELNIARGITIGREVAMGPASKYYTHGTWGSVWEGRPERWGPITIGDYAWMTYARVHPNVRIGHNTVIATGSIVDVDVPDGTHVMGEPVSRFRDKWKFNKYPAKISDEDKQAHIKIVKYEAESRLKYDKGINHTFDVRRLDEDLYDVDGIKFYMDLPRKIEGSVDDKTREPMKIFVDQIRRRTIRADYKLENDKFVPYPQLDKRSVQKY